MLNVSLKDDDHNSWKYNFKTDQYLLETACVVIATEDLINVRYFIPAFTLH